MNYTPLFVFCFCNLFCGHDSFADEGADRDVLRSAIDVDLKPGTFVHNAGIFLPGQKRTFDFRLLNKSDTPLKIAGAELSCGCLDVKSAEAEVTARGQTVFGIEVTAAKSSGNQVQYVVFDLVAADKKYRKKLVISYEARAPYEVKLRSKRWSIDESDVLGSKLIFDVAGYHGFDVSALSFAVHGVQANFSTKEIVPKGNETARVRVTASLCEKPTKGLPMAVVLNAFCSGKKNSRQYINLLLVNASFVSVNPKVVYPRDSGDIVLYFTFESAVQETPSFSVRPTGGEEVKTAMRRISERIFQVRILSDAVKSPQREWQAEISHQQRKRTLSFSMAKRSTTND